jgi:hypothetical protein
MAQEKTAFLGLPPTFTFKDSLSNASRLLSADPRVLGHRHDQTVASVIAHSLGIIPEYNYCFDYIGEARPGQPYAHYIPPHVIILQNRDIKTETYLTAIDRFLNTTGRRKLLQMLWNYIRGNVRFLKDWLWYHTVFKRRYPFLRSS